MIDVYYACKYYRDGLGLEQVRLTVEKGEIVGIFGENGAGKTTLLRAIAGLLNLNYGNITVDGKETHNCRNISYMSERGSFFPDLTVAEHRQFLQVMQPSFSCRKFDLLTDFFNLQTKKKLKEFSSGQQSRFELCCGLSLNVDWYLVDEPFIGKDFIGRRDFVKLLSGFLPEKSSLVMATHLASEIEPLLTRIVVMQQGRIIDDRPIETIYEKNRNLADYLRDICGYDENRALDILNSMWAEEDE